MSQHQQQQQPTGGEAYDRVPYTSHPYRETHPRKLHGVAHLLGLEAPDVRTCRVLELGCATGGNLVPMGEQLPGARLVGMDYSAVQVARAREFAEGAGVRNVEFRHASIADLGRDVGEFDYVICHGVFSWVTRALQEQIFRVCQEVLSPNGVAYVSFNTLPGSYGRQWVREAILFHTAGIEDPAKRVAAGKEFLRVLVASPLSKPHHVAMLKEEFGQIDERTDDYVVHEYLAEANEPVYFEEFMRRAGGYGLQYVADARVNGAPAEESWPPAKGILAGAGEDLVRREQYVDFLRNRSFRRAILCRSDVRLDRGGMSERLGGMWVAGQLRETGRTPEGVTRFVAVTGSTYWAADPAAVEAVRKIIAAYPAEVRADALGAGVRAELRKMWEANLVELYATPGEAGGGGEAGGRPRGSGVGRHLAARGERVTNLRHEPVMVNDEQRRVLLACDGSREAGEVARAAGVSEGRVGEILAQLGRLGLLVG